MLTHPHMSGGGTHQGCYRAWQDGWMRERGKGVLVCVLVCVLVLVLMELGAKI